jgi:hypothetical protein
MNESPGQSSAHMHITNNAYYFGTLEDTSASRMDLSGLEDSKPMIMRDEWKWTNNPPMHPQLG